MEYLLPGTNAVLDADLSMTNVVPSLAIERTDESPKTGGGAVVVAGPFVGDVDALVDVQVVDTVIDGAPAASAPRFSGVGNGTLADIAADNTWDAEVITVTLEDLGTQTRLGQAPFQGLILQAKTPESAPVATIARNLVLTRTAFAVRETISAGTDTLTQEYFDYGAAPVTSDGNIPRNAPRLIFGVDPQVYWHYRRYNYDSGRWEYGLSPRPIRPIPAGATVWAVTGDYSITIADEGAEPETFAGIVTFYDAATAIRDGSTLVTVQGAIGFDQRPGGSAVTDLSVNTASYCAEILRQGTEIVRRADIELVVLPGAPTETLTITNIGGSNWDVRGDASGLLARAITNALYESEHYQFRVPSPPIDPAQVGKGILVEFVPVHREEGQPAPQLCLPDTGDLGINARNGTWEFIYDFHPTAPCDCDDYVIDGPPSDDCLGIENEEAIPVSAAAHKRRVERVMRWHSEFTRAQTPLYTARNFDIDYADRQRDYAIKCLDQLIKKGQLTFDSWVAGKTYAADALIAVGGYRYATNGGVSGGVAPVSWGTEVGGTTADNGMLWENVGQAPLAAFDSFFAEIVGLASYLQFDRGAAWSAGSYAGIPATIQAGQIYEPTVRTGHTYLAETEGSTVGVEPSPWPIDGTTVTVGDIVWRDRGAYWEPSHTYAVGFRTVIPGHGAYVVKVGGDSGSSQPDWTGEYGREIPDGGVVWALESDRSMFTAPNLANEVAQKHYRRTETAANAVLATGGVVGNFSVSSGGDSCWTPDLTKPGGFFYRGSDTPGYVEVYVGNHYVSSKPGRDANNNVVVNSTKEFAFAPALSCPDSLQPGDKFIVTIWGVNGVTGGYQEGDQFACAITYAKPLQLAGGQVGNDTLTWSVIGSASGRQADYALVTTALAPYSSSGLGFAITPGGIPFSLRDRFEFAFEGGHARYRLNGGAWSAPFAIASSVPLTAGLIAEFSGGRPPSWAVGDTWSFRALALNGVGNIRMPSNARARWSGSTEIVIAPSELTGGVLMIAGHTIPATASIVFEGSNDDFGSSEFSSVLSWRANDVIAAVPTECASYRLLIDDSGGIQWLWLQHPLLLKTQNGANELGRITKRRVMPSRSVRGGTGLTVEHDAISQTSYDALDAGLSNACESYGRRLGVIPNRVEGDAGLYRYVDDSLRVGDSGGFQPRETRHRWLSFSLNLDPAR